MTFYYAKKSSWQNPISTYKNGLRERRHCWDTIANNLHIMKEEKFIVDQRSVRDLHKRKMVEDEKASVQKSQKLMTALKILQKGQGTYKNSLQWGMAMERKKMHVVQKEKERAENE